MEDNGKSIGSSILVSRYGLVSIGNKSDDEARDCGWESADGEGTYSYSD